MGTKYEIDLSEKTAEEVADLISDWRNDDEAGVEAAGDLFRSIESWIRANCVEWPEIKPEPVVFDKRGQFYNSAVHSIPEFYDEKSYTEIPLFKGYEVVMVRFDDDEPNPIFQADAPADFRKLPELPTREGFFILQMDDDEEGPRVVFVRKKEAVAE